MKILIKNARLLDVRHPKNGEQVNILVEDGIIRAVGGEHNADTVLEGSDLCVSIGWFDMRTTIGEPGNEHKEDLESASRAAAAGGFTGIACMPNTIPSIQTKDAVAYLRSRSANSLVSAYPIASVTLNNAGKDLTEMIDLNHAGAVAFSDGNLPIWHTDVILKSLQYVQMFDGLLINHAEDHLLTHGAQMNESELSTRLGLKGFPYLAEELMIARDLRILEYTGGRIHFATVSSPGSLKLIKEAKANGLQVTCDMAAYQLAMSEELLDTFDTNYKVNPPLRSRNDISQFWDYVREGVVDVLVSDHIPQDVESKKLEFDLAEFGMNGLETFLPLILSASSDFPLDQLVARFSMAPRKLLGLPVPEIKEGERADLTVFSTSEQWQLTEARMQSRSFNSPLLEQPLKGRVKAVFHNLQNAMF